MEKNALDKHQASSMIRQIMESPVIDVLVKLVVPILLGLFGYAFAWAIDINTRLIAVESNKMSREEMRHLETKLNAHEQSIMLIQDKQNSVIEVQNRMLNSQQAILLNQGELKATLAEVAKQLDRLLSR